MMINIVSSHRNRFQKRQLFSSTQLIVLLCSLFAFFTFTIFSLQLEQSARLKRRISQRKNKRMDDRRSNQDEIKLPVASSALLYLHNSTHSHLETRFNYNPILRQTVALSKCALSNSQVISKIYLNFLIVINTTAIQVESLEEQELEIFNGVLLRVGLYLHMLQS